MIFSMLQATRTESLPSASLLVLLILICSIYYYFVIRPKKEEQKIVNMKQDISIPARQNEVDRQLSELKTLYDSGALTHEEYKDMCRKVMGL